MYTQYPMFWNKSAPPTSCVDGALDDYPSRLLERCYDVLSRFGSVLQLFRLVASEMRDHMWMLRCLSVGEHDTVRCEQQILALDDTLMLV